MNLIASIKTIQRALGVTADGVFGPRTAQVVMAHLSINDIISSEGIPTCTIDARTEQAIQTLDVKARDHFRRFVLLAKATAATMGCDYIGICGTRTMAEQAELKHRSDAGGPHAAAAGYSWHNFGIAVDFGVFQANGKIYLDDTRPALAKQVHAACACHARDCGLEWGGEWSGKSCDPPHYQIFMGHSTPSSADRAAYQQEGSVL